MLQFKKDILINKLSQWQAWLKKFRSFSKNHEIHEVYNMNSQRAAKSSCENPQSTQKKLYDRLTLANQFVVLNLLGEPYLPIRIDNAWYKLGCRSALKASSKCSNLPQTINHGLP